MSATHTHAERFTLTEHAQEQRLLHRARLAQLRVQRATERNNSAEQASSSEDPSDDTDEERSSDTDHSPDNDCYYFLQPVPTWQRRQLLRAAGVRRIDSLEKDECRDIRASREHCGCACKGYCDPESCPCSRANVKCQVITNKSANFFCKLILNLYHMCFFFGFFRLTERDFPAVARAMVVPTAQVASNLTPCEYVPTSSTR